MKKAVEGGGGGEVDEWRTGELIIDESFIGRAVESSVSSDASLTGSEVMLVRILKMKTFVHTFHE